MKLKAILPSVILLAFIAGGVFGLVNMKNLFIAFESKQLEELNVVYNNIYIRGNAVGGLTKEQAKEKMNLIINEEYGGDKKLDFALAQTNYERSFTYPELGMGFNTEKAVEEAYLIGRNADGSINRGTVAELNVGGKYIDAESTYSDDKVKEALSQMEAEVNELLEPLGQTMDLDRTAEAAEQMLAVNEYDSLIIIAVK